jgi:hypothetical protein
MITGTQLANELDRLGVHFVTGGKAGSPLPIVEPETLLVELAASPEARLRLALIPLLLRHPEYGRYASGAAQRLKPAATILFQCYYTAALFLQQKYVARLTLLFGPHATLPDLFSTHLGVHTSGNPDEQLKSLAQRQAILSGEKINWYGTYEHGAQQFLTHFEQRMAWAN